MVPLKGSSKSTSTLGDSIESMSGDFGDEKRSTEYLTETYTKEDPSIYKPLIKKF